MRVDTAPGWARFLLTVYGVALASVWYLYMLLLRPTIRVTVVDAEQLRPGQHYVFCHWHDAIPLLFQAGTPRIPRVLMQRPHAWLQHPLWYMKPVHVVLRMLGVRRIVLGSSGHDGRAAADTLVQMLREGYSTFVFPDGPAGPRHELKLGVLHMAQQSGVPIVPLRLSGSRVRRARTWDRKALALPFSTITVRIGEPISVANDEDFARVKDTLTAALG